MKEGRLETRAMRARHYTNFTHIQYIPIYSRRRRRWWWWWWWRWRERERERVCECKCKCSDIMQRLMCNKVRLHCVFVRVHLYIYIWKKGLVLFAIIHPCEAWITRWLLRDDGIFREQSCVLILWSKNFFFTSQRGEFFRSCERVSYY